MQFASFFSKTKYPSISCIKRVITATTYKVFPPNPSCVRHWLRKQIYILRSRENNPLIASYSLDTMQGILVIDNNQSTYIRKPFQYFFNMLLFNIIFIQKNPNATWKFQGTSQIRRQSNTFYCQLNKYASSFHINHLAGYHQLPVIQQHIKWFSPLLMSLCFGPHPIITHPYQKHTNCFVKSTSTISPITTKFLHIYNKMSLNSLSSQTIITHPYPNHKTFFVKSTSIISPNTTKIPHIQQ